MRAHMSLRSSRSVLCIVVSLACFSGSEWPHASARAAEVKNLSDGPGAVASIAIPVAFVANAGQLPAHVYFEAVTPGIRGYFERSRLVFAHNGSTPVRITFPGSSDVTPAGRTGLAGSFNYIVKDATRASRAYDAVVYRELFKGIDLTVRHSESALEKLFSVDAKADPHVIRMAYSAKELSLDKEGRLRVVMPQGEFIESRPVAFQMIDGVQHHVDIAYRLIDELTVGFTIGSYDRQSELIIDPVLRASTYLGGNDDERAHAVAFDATGIYVAGLTFSTNYPATTTFGTVPRAFVTKLSLDGRTILYSTVFGGTAGTFGRGLQIRNGMAYVIGLTSTPDFPVCTGVNLPAGCLAAAFQSSYGGGGADYFVVALTPAGNQFAVSTFLGGAGSEGGTGENIAVIPSGDILIAGSSESANWPTTALRGDLRGTRAGTEDVVIARLTSNGSSLTYSGYWGGSDSDDVGSMTVDSSGQNMYVIANTLSTDTPLCTGAGAPYSRCIAAGYSGGNLGYPIFLTRFDTADAKVLASTGQPGSLAGGVAVDAGGNVYITGRTSTGVSNAGPGTPGVVQPQAAVLPDAFAVKFDSALSSQLYATFLGGNQGDVGTDIAVTDSGQAYIVGQTASTNFRTTADAFQRTLRGISDAFVTKLSADGTRMGFSTLLGGTGNDYLVRVRTNSNGGAIITAGSTSSSDLPVTSGAADPSYNGGIFDGFVLSLSAAPTDFNDDGHPDLVWQHSIDKSLVAWHLRGVTMNTSGYLNPAAVADKNWSVVATGDFNSDGSSDLLWQNQITIELVVWYMRGVTRSSARPSSTRLPFQIRRGVS